MTNTILGIFVVLYCKCYSMHLYLEQCQNQNESPGTKHSFTVYTCI